MSYLVITEQAAFDLKRLYHFLQDKNQTAADRMLVTVLESIDRLAASPFLGVRCGLYRRLLIKFGSQAYFAFYTYDAVVDSVRVIWVQHSREDISHPDHGKH